MAKIDVKSVRDVENSVRDFKNWLAAFKTEYDLADEAVEVLDEKIAELSDDCKEIKCDRSGKVDAGSVKTVANALRDTKNWLATFAEEYKLPEEAVDVLSDELDKIGKKLAAVECK